MAGRSSRQRRANSAHKDQVGRLQNEVSLQSSYVSTYWTFKGYADSGSGPASTGRYNNPGPRGGWTARDKANKEWENPRWDSYNTFTWYAPETMAAHRGGTKTVGKQYMDRFDFHQAASRKNTQSTWQNISDSYKSKAMSAEMGGLANAQKALTQAQSTGPRTVGSSRGWRGGTSSATKAKMKTEATRATGVFDSWSVSNSKKPEPVKSQVSPLLMQFSNKAPTAADLQMQAASNASGTIIFNKDGTIRSAPTTGEVNWSLYGDSNADRSLMKTQLGDYLIAKDIKTQLSDQLKSEKDIQGKIKSTKNVMDLMRLEDKLLKKQKQTQTEAKKTDLQKAKEKAADTAATTYAELYGFSSKDISSGSGGSIYSNTGRDKKYNELESTLQGLNVQATGVYKKRLTLGNALSSAGKDDVFRKMYSDGMISSGTLSRAVSINTDTDRTRNVNKLAVMNAEHNVIKGTIEKESQLYQRVKKLNDSKSNTSIWKAKRTTLFNELGIDEESKYKTTKDVMDQVDKELKISQAKSDRIQKEKRSLSYHIAVTSSGEERLAQAEGQNQNTINKREFESMTGLDLKVNETPEAATARYYKEKGLSAPKDQTDWYNTWLIGGGKGMLTSATDINLMKRDATLNTDLQGQIKGKASTLKKYGEWGQASSFIGSSLDEWKGDVSKYYKQKYYKKPSVSKEDVSLSWFGSRSAEGQSFAQVAMGEIGIRRGAGGSSDIKKILSQTQGYRGELVSHIDNIKQELVEVKKQQSIKQQEHDALRPLIDTKADESIAGGNIGHDEAFGKRLEVSSEELYDLNRGVAEREVTQTHYEQSLLKTDSDVELLEKKKRNIEFSIIKGTSSSGMINRTTRKGPLYGYHQMIGLRRRMGGAKNTKQMGGDNNQSLGGLVVSGNTNDSNIKRQERKYKNNEASV